MKYAKEGQSILPALPSNQRECPACGTPMQVPDGSLQSTHGGKCRKWFREMKRAKKLFNVRNK